MSSSPESTEPKPLRGRREGDGAAGSGTVAGPSFAPGSRQVNCAISVHQPADEEQQARQDDEGNGRRRFDALAIGNDIGPGTSRDQPRPRAHSMVVRLPSDSVRAAADRETAASFRRSKTIELANEWASDSELDSLDSDSLSSGPRMTPSPLLPMDDHSDSLAEAMRSLAEARFGSGEGLPAEGAGEQARGRPLTTRSERPANPPRFTLSTSSESGQERPLPVENHFLTPPVCTQAVSSDSEQQRDVSDDGGTSDRSALSAPRASSSSTDVSPSASRRWLKSGKPSGWGKLKRAVRSWQPFMQTYRRKYPWVQLAGHQGNFRAGENGTILKKFCDREYDALVRLNADVLRAFVPQSINKVEKEGEEYVVMQDLLLPFEVPSVMDIKMGIRTYLEEELTKLRQKPSYRNDLYEKMISVDPNEPTADEHERRAIDKPRYMIFREQCSSSSSLGFRIEGVKLPDKDPRSDFKKVKVMHEVARELEEFLEGNRKLWRSFLDKLKGLREACLKSEFFYTHEIIGSSLLFVAQQDASECGIWMIDFGKTSRLPEGQRLRHDVQWVEGNREDGYLLGLSNLIDIWSSICLGDDDAATPLAESVLGDSSARPDDAAVGAESA